MGDSYGKAFDGMVTLLLFAGLAIGSIVGCSVGAAVVWWLARGQ